MTDTDRVIHIERIRAAVILAQSEVIMHDIHLAVCNFFKREFAAPKESELEEQKPEDFAHVIVDTPWGRVRLSRDEATTNMPEIVRAVQDLDWKLGPMG